MSPVKEPVAIVGSSCRFPGGATSPSKMRDLLVQVRDLRQKIPPDRFQLESFFHKDGSHHGSTNVSKAY